MISIQLMKLTTSKVLVLCLLIAITQEARLKTKKLSLTSLRIQSGNISFHLGQLLTKYLKKLGFKPEATLAQTDFEIVYGLQENPDLSVKVISFEDEKDRELAINEIITQNELLDFSFSLPLCRSDKLKYEKKVEGVAIILPRGKEYLYEQYYREYLEAKDNKTEHEKKIKNSSNSDDETEEKIYEMFEPKLKQFVQMALGLKEFHETELIHRDIRLESYLIMREEDNPGRVVLANFKLATPEINEFSDDIEGTDGFIPFDFNKKKRKIWLSQKIDTFALGVTYLNMTIPQFFKCFYGFDECKFENFEEEFIKLSKYQPKVYKKFKEYLEKKEADGKRHISKIQRAVEDLVFDTLLTVLEKRISSEELVRQLKSIVPEKIFEEIETEFKGKPINCHGVQQIESINNVAEEFPDTYKSRINKPKKSHQKASKSFKKGLESYEDSDYSDESY